MIICTSPQCQTSAGCICQRLPSRAPYDLRTAYNEVFRLLDGLMGRGAWNHVEGVLMGLCLPHSIMTGVGAVRLCSSARDRMPHWTEIIAECRRILTAQGDNAGCILRGLEE